MPSRPGGDARTVWRPGRAVPLPALWGPMVRGAGDPAWRFDGATGVWRAFRTPAGAATLRLQVHAGDAEVIGTAWGPGAECAVADLPEMLGDLDEGAEGFDGVGLGRAAAWPGVGDAWRRYGRTWRVPRCPPVIDSLAAAVLEQRVTGVESRRAWRALLQAHGEPAPAAGEGPVPAGLRVPPDAAAWRRVPSWDWHRAGVDGSRSATLLRAAGAAGRLEECASLPAAAASARLRAIPGIGGWTAAETAQRALGDADAVSFGDFHLASVVVYAMTGRTGGDDDAMAELLEPWAGQRYRAVRMVELSGVDLPRRGPRAGITDHRGR